MLVRLEEAIKQKKFVNDHIHASINLYYTASQHLHYLNRILKPYQLSIQQFNILRILKGRKGEPISVKKLTDRMIDKMSNASRLVEKLRSKGLVERRACQNDRRQVEVLITSEGIEIVEKASILIEEGTMQYLSSLSGQDAKELNTLLDKINQ